MHHVSAAGSSLGVPALVSDSSDRFDLVGLGLSGMLE
jgi:hypothetical protein